MNSWSSNCPKERHNMKNSVIGRESTEKSNRRAFLKEAGAAGAAFAAASVLTQQAEAGQGTAQVLYVHGLVWNTALPGVAGELLITFDVRAVIGGAGLGTFADAVHPAINSHVAIDSATRHGNVYTLQGTVIRSNDADHIGTAVTAVLEKFGDSTIAQIQ